MKLRIGTRGSTLARRQVNLAIEAMAVTASNPEIEVIVVQTEGDQRQDVSLEALGGLGVFVNAIEQRLIDRTIDVAVHSFKDVPFQLPEGLCIAAVLPRADARDALVAREGLSLAELPDGARIGSDSRRRGVQLLAMRPDLRIQGIRGNVDTRLRKVEAGDYHAVVLALAGLERLGLQAKATQIFEATDVVPAPGQGAIALQCRADDAETLSLLSRLDHGDTRAATEAERAFLGVLGAGCRLPVGAYAIVSGETLKLQAVVADEAGTLHRGDATGSRTTATEVGTALGRRLKLAAGI